MKVLKGAFKVVLWVLAIVLVAVLTMPVWFGPVAKSVANAVVPGLVGADFRLGRLSFNPYDAKLAFGDLQLGNPRGYSEPCAVKVGDFLFNAETLSLVSDVIHIEEITLNGLFVSVVSGGENGVGNFTQIQYNVAGGKEKYEAAQQAEKPAEEVPAAEESEKPAKKIIVDRLTISGLRLQLGIVPISVPFDIVLTDIGKKSGGATLEEAWRQILDGVMGAAGGVGDGAKALSLAIGDGAGKTVKGTGKAIEDVSKGVRDLSKGLKGLLKQK